MSRVVSLVASATKEGSYQAANIWWKEKLSELGADSGRKKVIVDQLDSQSDYLEKLISHLDQLDKSSLEKIMSAQKADDVSVDELERLVLPGNLAPVDRTDKSVQSQIARYLLLEQARVKDGQISLVEYDLARRCLEYFEHWVQPQSNIAKIHTETWEEYWTHLVLLECSVEYKKKRFRYAKNFITWLASKELIAMPANLISRKYKFGSSAAKRTLHD